MRHGGEYGVRGLGKVANLESRTTTSILRRTLVEPIYVGTMHSPGVRSYGDSHWRRWSTFRWWYVPVV